MTLTNTGYATVTISSPTAADFRELSACGKSVAAGASCSIGVFFDPTVSGARTGTLTITDNASNGPQSVTLNGAGQDLSLDTSSSSTATVSPGQTASYAVALAPAGGFEETVSLTCVGAPAQSTCRNTQRRYAQQFRGNHDQGHRFDYGDFGDLGTAWRFFDGPQPGHMAGSRWLAGAGDPGYSGCQAAKQAPSTALWFVPPVSVLSWSHMVSLWWRRQRLGWQERNTGR